MDADEGEQYSDIRWKGEEYLDQRESDTEEGEEEELEGYRDWETDRKSTRLNSSHRSLSRMPSSA